MASLNTRIGFTTQWSYSNRADVPPSGEHFCPFWSTRSIGVRRILSRMSCISNLAFFLRLYRYVFTWSWLIPVTAATALIPLGSTTPGFAFTHL